MEATSWERVPPEIGHRPRVKCTFYEKNLTWQNPASISGSRNGLPGLDEPRPRHLGARILGSENGPSSARVCPKGSGPHSAAKQRRSFRVPPINPPEACVPKTVKATFCSKTGLFFSCGSRGSPGVRIRKRTLECSCVLKGVGAAFCSKTGPFFSCAPNKPSGGLCAQGGQGHVLQQNRVVLFV